MEDRALRILTCSLLAVSLLLSACAGLLPHEQATVAPRGQTLLASSAAAFQRGELGSAVTLAEDAEQEAVARDDFVLHARALFARAGMARWMGDTDTAMTLVEHGLSWARRATDPCLEADGLLVRSAVLYSMDDANLSAVDALDDIESLCESADVRARAALARARHAARAGNLEDARNLLRQTDAMFLPAGLQSALRQERLFLRAYTLGQEGNHYEAVQTLEAVLATDRRLNARTALVDDLWLLARLHRAGGNFPAARDAAERALAVLTAMTPSHMTAKRRQTIVEWLEELGPES